jgi:hypothetical protein
MDEENSFCHGYQYNASEDKRCKIPYANPVYNYYLD